MKVSVVKVDEGKIRRLGELAISGKAEQMIRTKDAVVGFGDYEGETVAVLIPVSELKASGKKLLDSIQ